ncbi:MAG: geranylgeranyl reductase family protein [Acidimicrobiales bacterium]
MSALSPTPQPVDVLIVGAGPAGCAAAITLHRSGLRVSVIDKAEFPRDKICGDGLTTSALRELDALGLDPASVASWVNIETAIVRSPSGREVIFPMPSDSGVYAAASRRRDLDFALVDLTRNAGIEVRENVALAAVTQDSAGVTITTENGEAIRCTYVIAADGMWSPTRKALGIAQPGYRGEWHAFRQYFSNVSPRAASELVVWFEADLLPGYAWSFPLADGTANVGFGILRDDSSYSVSNMGALWREFLSRPHVREFLGPDAIAESPHRAWPIPARVDRVALTQERTLFVGDAATATDPMTGEGIGQALLTGRWAAEAIIANLYDPVACARQYCHSVSTELAVDHRFAERLMTVLRHPRGARGAVRVAGLSDWTRRNFARWLFEDYPRALLLTPRRWHKGMLSGSGAYRVTHAHPSDRSSRN